jgi:TonB family protein
MQRLLIFYAALFTFASPVLALPEALRKLAWYAKRPEYPLAAQRAHLTGYGLFALHVRADGSVERVETVKSIGHTSLDRAAIAAFRVWRFHPRNASWTIRFPIRYVDGPVRFDESMKRPPVPGYGSGNILKRGGELIVDGDLITIFSGVKGPKE